MQKISVYQKLFATLHLAKYLLARDLDNYNTKKPQTEWH